MGARNSLLTNIVMAISTDASKVPGQMQAAGDAIITIMEKVRKKEEEVSLSSSARTKEIEQLEAKLNQNQLARGAQILEMEKKIQASKARTAELTAKQQEADRKDAQRTAQSDRIDNQRQRSIDYHETVKTNANNSLTKLTGQKAILEEELVINTTKAKGTMDTFYQDLEKKQKAVEKAIADSLSASATVKGLEESLRHIDALGAKMERLQSEAKSLEGKQGSGKDDASNLALQTALKKKLEEIETVQHAINAEEGTSERLAAARLTLDNKEVAVVDAYQAKLRSQVEYAKALAGQQTNMTSAQIAGASRVLTIEKQLLTNAQETAAAKLRIQNADARIASAEDKAAERHESLDNKGNKIAETDPVILENLEKEKKVLDQLRAKALEEEAAFTNGQGKIKDSIEKNEGAITKYGNEFTDTANKAIRDTGRLETKIEELGKKSSSSSFGAGMVGGITKALGLSSSALEGFTFQKFFGGEWASGLAGMAAGFIAVKAPMAAVTGLFQLGKFAVSEFFNVARAGFSSISNMISQAVSLNEEVVQFSAKTGIAQADASKFVGELQVLGISSGNAAMGMLTLTKAIADNNKNLTSMGIATRDANGNLRGTADVIEDLRKKYAMLNEEGKKSFLANLANISPRAAAIIIPLIKLDPSVVTALEKLNVVLGPENQRQMNVASGAMKAIALAMSGVAKTITIALAPALRDLAVVLVGALIQNLPRIQAFFSAISNGIHDFISVLGIFGGGKEIVDSFAGAMDQATSDGSEGLQSEADAAGDAASAVNALDAQIKSLTSSQKAAATEAKNLSDAMKELLDPIEKAEEEISRAVEAETRPIEANIRALNARKKAWEDTQKAADRVIDDEVQVLTRANQAIKDGLEDATLPLDAALRDLQNAQRTADRAHDTAVDNLGDKPEVDHAAIRAIDDQVKALDRETKAIQQEEKARAAAQKALIDGQQLQQKAIDDQIKAINDARQAVEDAKEIEKEAIQEKIKAIQEEGKVDSDIARDKEYWDQRAYLMGQTLLAQEEAKGRALSDRQSRQRNSGESDTDYQLRIQQLNSSNTVDSLKHQGDITKLDTAHALDAENQARQNKIDLLQATLDLMDKESKDRKTADDHTIKGLQDQKDAIQALIDNENLLGDAAQDANQKLLDGIAETKDGLEQTKEDMNDAASTLADAWDAAKKAIDDTYNAEKDANQRSQDDITDQITSLKLVADEKTRINDRELERLGNLKDDQDRVFQDNIDGIQREIDADQALIDQKKQSAEDAIYLLKLQADAIHDLYDPQIAAAQKVADSYDAQIQALNDQKDAIQEVQKATEELATSQSNSIKDFLSDIKNVNDAVHNMEGPGAKAGMWVKEHIIDPVSKFIHRNDVNSDDPNIAGVGNNAPQTSLKDTVLQILSDTWDDVAGPAADKAADFLLDVLGKAAQLMLGKAVDWVMDNKAKLLVFMLTLIGSILLLPVGGPFDIILIGFAILLIESLIGKIIDAAGPMFKAGKDLLMELLNGGAEVLKDLGKWLYDNVIKRIIDWVTEWGKLTKYFIDFWTELLTAGVTAFAEIAKWLYDHIIQPIFMFLLDVAELYAKTYIFFGTMLLAGAKALFKIVEWLTEHIIAPILGWLIDRASDLWNGAKDFFQNFFDGALKIMEQLGEWLTAHIWNPIDTFFTETVPKILSGGGDIAQGFLDGMFDKIKDIAGWLKTNIGDPILGFFGGLGSGIKSAFGNLWGMISGPIHTAYDGFAGFINGMAGIVEKVASALGIKIDLPRMGDWTEPTTYNGNDPGMNYPPEYADGARVDSPEYAHIAEGGYPEYVISTDPSKKKRSMGLVQQLLTEMGGGRSSGKGMGGPIDVPGIDLPSIPNPFGIIGSGVSLLNDAKNAVINWSREQLAHGISEALSAVANTVLGPFKEMFPGNLLYGGAGSLIRHASDWISGAKDTYDAAHPQGGHSDLSNIFKGQGTPAESFGWTDFAAAGGYGGLPHTGVDVDNPMGTPLYAPGTSDIDQVIDYGSLHTGKTLGMRLMDGFHVLLGHLSEIDVSLGDHISDMNKMVGRVGSTGYSTGPHTHVELRNPEGALIDPGPSLPLWKSWWGSDLSPFNRGGMIRPNSTIIDANGRPYATAGEGGLLEAVMPMDFFKRVAATTMDNAVSRISSSSMTNGGITIGEINISTQSTDAAGVGREVKEQLKEFFSELPAHAAAVRPLGKG